jgi:hypothetical protein
MRTRTLTIGLVILAVGVALAAVGWYNLRNTTTSITSFTQPSAGEYVSAEMVLNDSVVVIRSPASVGGMVPAQDISAVNSANIGSYAVPYNSTAASSDTYIGLRGDFNYVAFSSTQPVTRIVITGTLLGTIGSGLLVLAGIICAIVGIIVTIVGAVRKGPSKKAISPDDEYYAKRDTAPPPTR